MSYRFLFDECLSPKLVQLAVQSGFGESTCIRDRGLAGVPDWRVAEFAAEGDFTLVTHNSSDFRGHGASMPGGIYGRIGIHAGLICLNTVHVMSTVRQKALFEHALRELTELPDLVNQCLEVHEAADGSVTIDVYRIPIPSDTWVVEEAPPIWNGLPLRPSFLQAAS